MIRRLIFAVGVGGILFAFHGTAFGQTVCKTPPFITAGVSPNVLIVFDTSGSMRNVIWHEEFDSRKLAHMVDSAGRADPLLPAGDDEVVFGQTAGSCSGYPHRVWKDEKKGRVILDYWKVRADSNDICDTQRMRGTDVEESDENGYFYFDRENKRFITGTAYDPGSPNHVRVFLPYVAVGDHPSTSSSEYTRYDYNYINWIFYRSTDTQREEVKRFFDEEQENLNRILTAQNVITKVVQNTGGVRFGVMRFDGSTGGRLIAPVGADVSTIVSEVRNQWAEGWTPLAETMEDVWAYFTGPDSPIEYWCQKNFVILITDGLPTRDSNDLSPELKKNWDLDRTGRLDDSEENVYPDDGSDYLDDMAFYLYQNDARPDLRLGDEIRNVHTFTIGLTTSSDLLLETAFNGNGVRDHIAEWDDPSSGYYRRFYYLADNFDQLLRAIENALVEVSIANSSGTSVSVSSSATSIEDLLFRASFNSAGWKGFLDAFEVKDGVDRLEPAKWKAGEILKTTNPADRKIYTALKSPTGIDDKLVFDEANVAATDVDGTRLFELLDQNSANKGKDIINFIRGVDVNGFRNRDGYKLGDIVHSTPVVVGPPSGFFNDPTYIEFRRRQALRERMLYVGANDGMLHAFYIDEPRGGKEAWGFIPHNLLGKLKNLTSPDYDSCHEYFVDLPPTVADVFVDPDGPGPEARQWRSLLMGGEREGGAAYFALDVTDPEADQFTPRWEFSDSHLGESWSLPAVEKISIGGSDKWLAFVGSGFNNDDRKGYLFAIDLESGGNLRDPMELGPQSPNVPASPRAVDINGDDYADTLSFGDLSGKAWRFDITDQTTRPKTYRPRDPAEWQGQEIFQTLPDQPITLPVGLSYYCAGPSDRECQNLITYFGTGKYLTTADKTDVAPQSFYAIKDEFLPLTRDDLADRTTDNCPEVSEPGKGWYVDLEIPGERVSSPPLIIGGLVFFLTFVPNLDDLCSAGGTTYISYREFDTGCVPNRTVFEEDPDPAGEARPVGRIAIGPGYASEIFYYANTQEMLIQTSDRTVHSRKVSLPRGGIENYGWREVFY